MSPKPRGDGEGTADRRWILLFALGLAAISAVVAARALAIHLAGDPPVLAGDVEPASLDDLAERADLFDPCGGTSEDLLILCKFGDDGALSVYLSRQGRVSPLVDSGDGPGWYIGVDLSPDEKLIALTSADGSDRTGYYVSIMAVESRRQLTTGDTATCWSYGWPSWSSDGERLSVTATAPDGREGTIVLAADGAVVARKPARGWPTC